MDQESLHVLPFLYLLSIKRQKIQITFALVLLRIPILSSKRPTDSKARIFELPNLLNPLFLTLGGIQEIILTIVRFSQWVNFFLAHGLPKKTGGDENMEAYCVKCRSKREMKDPEKITMKNGRPATKGICPSCGTKMFRIGKS